MSRFRRAIHSVTAGYLLLAVTALYALGSVPLALHYLSKERFGLWSLMASIGGYLSLIDLGISGSVARLLVDHKDDRQGGSYGGLILTGWLVLAVQGCLVFGVGCALAPLLASLLKIPPHLTPEFIGLLRWQALALALGFATRIFSHLLQAHQRMDITNYSQICTLGLNFVLLWVFFHAGFGVFSLVWALLISTTCGWLVGLAACWRLELFPPRGSWGRPTWPQFREIFVFGADVFLVAVGTQLIMASQSAIITRRLGLESAALWNVGTRVFNLLSQAIWRVFDVSAPGFSEMMVRGERLLLRERYQTMVILSASLSGLAAVVFALCNSPFITVWTMHSDPPMSWPPVNDLWLGIWMIVLAILHCHNALAMTTKKIAGMRYIYFIEGLVFVGAALLVCGRFGLRGVIVSSILCSSAFSGAYGVYRISRLFDVRWQEVAFTWMAPMARVLVLFVPLALAVWWATTPLSDILRLAIHAAVGGTAGTYLFLRFGLPVSFQREILQRAPQPINPLLRWVFAV
jgi:O-antigen/teichoic acid export membrane protein